MLFGPWRAGLPTVSHCPIQPGPIIAFVEPLIVCSSTAPRTPSSLTKHPNAKTKL